MNASLAVGLSELVRDALEKRVAALESLLVLWTAIVVLGLLYEYLYEFAHSLRPLKVFKVMERIGAIMVVGGVVGEMYIEFAMSPPQEQLRSLNDGSIAGLGGQSARTNERAAKLEVEASALRRQAAALLAEVASAEAEAAEAQSMAKSAELARAELEARIAPRTLTLAQRKYIGKALRRFAIGFFARRVKIHWQPNDPEAAIFGVEIRDALLRASIPVEIDGTFIVGNTGWGVKITGTGNDLEFIKTIDVLVRTNTSSTVSWEVNPKYIGSPLSIDVATKPPLGLDTLGQMIPEQTSPKEEIVRGPMPDRHLTGEQQSRIARELYPFIGQRVSFVLYQGDSEILGIANEIDAALDVARWIRSLSKPPTSGAIRGIAIEVDNSATDRDRNAAEWLVSTLREERLDVVGPRRSNQGTWHQVAPIAIIIGKNQ